MPAYLDPTDCLLAKASALAYCIQPGPLHPGVPVHLPETARFYHEVIAGEPTVFVGGTEKIDAAFVSETRDDRVVVAFRGTLPPFVGSFWEWVDDWMEDFDVDPVPWRVKDQTVPYGRVEHGFDTAVHDLWRTIPGHGPLAATGIRDALAQIDWTTKKGVLVTGHSKGAAATFLAASLIQAELDLPVGFVRVVCFAAPYTCDAEFKRCYAEAGLDEHTVRYQNVDDLVPFVPNWAVVGPLTLARWVSREVSGRTGGAPWTWAYVRIGHGRYITRECEVRTGPSAHLLATCRIWADLLTLQLGRVASAHSMVHDPASAHPTGRYSQAVCGTPVPTPCPDPEPPATPPAVP